MRNLKKFLSLLLAVMMVATAGIIVSAEETPDYTEAENVLAKIGVFKGYGDNNYGWDENISRVQMALLLSRMMTGKINDEDEKYWENVTETCVFEDMVTDSYDYTAYTGAVMYCYLQNIIKGTSTTEMLFNPQGKITLDEAITFICRALGYDSDVWPVGFRMFADEHGILNNISANWKDELTRAEIAQLLYNMINVISGNDIGAAEWPYPGDDFAMFDEFSVESVVKNGKFINEFRNEGEIVYSVDCPITENAPAASVVYDAAGKAVDTAAKDYVASDYTHEANYILYDGSIVELVLEGAYDAVANTIKYADGIDHTPVTVEELRVVSYDKEDKELFFYNAEDEEVYLSLNTKVLAGVTAIDAEKLAKDNKNKLFTVVYDDNGIIEVEGIDAVSTGLAVFEGVALEFDAEGQTTGNLVVTVLPKSNGFTESKEIVVRSVYLEYLNYTNVWEDDLTDDNNTHNIGVRGNDLYEAYELLTKKLNEGGWLVTITEDKHGKFDISAAPTYYGEFITINEYSEKNVLAYVDGIYWDDNGNKNKVLDNGELKLDEDDGTAKSYTSSSFYTWVNDGTETDKGGKDDHLYGAKGNLYTLNDEVTFVVVNQKTGKTAVFQNQPISGMWITGYFASENLVDKDGYCVVVTNPTDEVPFDLEPRATYVQVEGLKGKTEQFRNVIALGGYNIPVYTYNYTITGLVDPATKEAIDPIVFAGLTEAQYLAIKAEMSEWGKFVVENEFIYKLYTNENAEFAALPNVLFATTTWAEYWEEYDEYDATLAWVDGTTLLNHQDKFFGLLDQFQSIPKDAKFEDYKIKYERLDDVDYLAYPEFGSDRINKNYVYDVGVNFDEDAKTLYVYYEKVGAKVEIKKFDYDVNGNGEIKDKDGVQEVGLTYTVTVDMPNYMGLNGVELSWDTNGRTSAYLPFGTTLYIAADSSNIIDGTATAKIKVGGIERTIELENGKVGKYVTDEEKLIEVAHTASVDLATVMNPDNEGWNENGYKHLTWNEMFSDFRNLKYSDEDFKALFTDYIYWNSHNELKAQYQVFDLKWYGEIWEYNKWYVAINNVIDEVDEDETTVIKTAEKWDEITTVDWVIDTFTAERASDATVAATEWKEKDYVDLYYAVDGGAGDRSIEAHWYTYGYFAPYAAGNTTINTYEKVLADKNTDGYYFVEISWDEYKANIQNKLDGKDYNKNYLKIDITLVPGYLTLELSEVVKDEKCNCGKYTSDKIYNPTTAGWGNHKIETPADACTTEHTCGTKVDIMFIDAYADELDKDGNLVPYTYESIEEVWYDDGVDGYINDAKLQGGFYQKPVDWSDKKDIQAAHNWYKLVLDENRDADVIKTTDRVDSPAFENLMAKATELKKDAYEAFWNALVKIYHAFWGISPYGLM